MRGKPTQAMPLPILGQAQQGKCQRTGSETYMLFERGPFARDG